MSSSEDVRQRGDVRAGHHSARRRVHPALVVFVALAVAHVAALYWPRVDVEGPVTWSDKVVHVVLFAAPTFAGLTARLRPALVIGLLAVHAPVSELVQHFLLPNRSGDLGDAVADLGGVVLGVSIFVVGRARRRW